MACDVASLLGRSVSKVQRRSRCKSFFFFFYPPADGEI